MPEQQFDKMIAAMPAIADAVNSFKSESAQELVLRTLLESLGAKSRDNVAEPTSYRQQDPEQSDVSSEGEGTTTTRRARKATSRRPGASDPSMDDDLNIHPEGIESLKDFYARVAPKNQNEQVLTLAYWLRQIAKIDVVGYDQIFTGFRLLAVKVPGSLGGKISQTGSLGWLKDTKSNNVTVSVAGINYLEHEMLTRQKTD